MSVIRATPYAFEEIQSALLQKFAALQKICEQSGLRVLMPETGEVPSRFIVITDNTEERDALQDRFQWAGNLCGCTLELTTVASLRQASSLISLFPYPFIHC